MQAVNKWNGNWSGLWSQGGNQSKVRVRLVLLSYPTPVLDRARLAFVGLGSPLKLRLREFSARSQMDGLLTDVLCTHSPAMGKRPHCCTVPFTSTSVSAAWETNA